MSAVAYLAAILGCGLGACVRFALTWLDTRRVFPWPTIAANVLGAALLGAVLAQGDLGAASPTTVFILGTGIAGGLSTFSSLAVDAATLWRDSRRGACLGYCLATLGAGLAAAGLGYGLGSLLA